MSSIVVPNELELCQRRISPTREVLVNGRIIHLAEVGKEFKLFRRVPNNATEVGVDLAVASIGVAEFQYTIWSRRSSSLNLFPRSDPVLTGHDHRFSFHWRISSDSG